jgi:ankyrin repeat protein
MITLQPIRASDEEALWEAARKGQVEAVKTLLSKGIDVNAKTAYGATALSYAAEKGHMEVVKLLVEQKAAVNVKDRFYNSTPLAWAMYRSHWEIVKIDALGRPEGHARRTRGDRRVAAEGRGQGTGARED